MIASTAAAVLSQGPPDPDAESDLSWLCDRYRDQAVGYAFSVLRDRALAEDAVQVAFSRILARVKGGDQELLLEDPERVVVRNTRWAALELVGRRRRTETSELDGDVVGPSDLAGRVWERSQARMLCDQIANSLPAHYLDVLRMRFVEERQDADGAARLRLSLKAYRCRVDRALRAARLTATRLGIDSLGGVVLAWRSSWRRLGQLRPRGLAEGTDLAQIGSVGAHGLVVILAIGGLAVTPLLVGGASSKPGSSGEPPTLHSGLVSSAATATSSGGATARTCSGVCPAGPLPEVSAPAATSPIGPAPQLPNPSLSRNAIALRLPATVPPLLAEPVPTPGLPLPSVTPDF